MLRLLCSLFNDSLIGILACLLFFQQCICVRESGRVVHGCNMSTCLMKGASMVGGLPSLMPSVMHPQNTQNRQSKGTKGPIPVRLLCWSGWQGHQCWEGLVPHEWWPGSACAPECTSACDASRCCLQEHTLELIGSVSSLQSLSSL